jgi:glycosyltransferase involved in cell wall biosynthesis
MTIKPLLQPVFLLRWIYHIFFKPIFNLLPHRRRNQMMTIAHHIKTTLFYGQVIDFSSGCEVRPRIRDRILKNAASRDDLIPPWVIEEMRELAKIDPDLFPSPSYLARYHIYQPIINEGPGRIYAECLKIIGESNPQVIFIAPWLKRGGADLGTLHHIAACNKMGLQAVLITTLDAESPWLTKVPGNVPTIELGRLGKELSGAERMAVLVRLVLQTKASTIHVIQSELGWEMVKTHGKSLRAESKLVFASLYCDDYDYAGQNQGYARYYLPSALPYLSGIISDNAYYPAKLSHRFGVDSSKLHTVYFPFLKASEPRYISANRGSVLWASRITYQKKPDLLLKIAAAMPTVHFHVRGHAETWEEKQMAKKISALSNVTFTGSYEQEGLVEAGDKFSLFLYTSLTDGMPNVLLEATMAGLPIVASSVGGVPELINEETGYLVSDVGSAEAYVAAITEALNDQEERFKRWRKAVELVQKRHAQQHFLKKLTQINGYFSPEPETKQTVVNIAEKFPSTQDAIQATPITPLRHKSLADA